MLVYRCKSIMCLLPRQYLSHKRRSSMQSFPQKNLHILYQIQCLYKQCQPLPPTIQHCMPIPALLSSDAATSEVLISRWVPTDKTKTSQKLGSNLQPVDKLQKTGNPKVDADDSNYTSTSDHRTCDTACKCARFNQPSVRHPCKDEPISAGTARIPH